MKYKYIIVVILVLLVSMFGYYFRFYQAGKTVRSNSASPVSIHDLVNQTVALNGVATNAKAGAVLLVENEPVYIEGLDNWPDNMLDREISVSGKLVFKNYIPQAEIRETDEISQGGGGGKNYVLENVELEKYR